MANIEMISNCELIKIKHLKPGDIFAADKPRFDGCTCQLYVYTDHKTPATTLCITDANLRGFSYEDEVYRYDEYFVTGLRLEPNGADTFGGLGIGDVFLFDDHICVKIEEHYMKYGGPFNAVSINGGYCCRFVEEAKVECISNMTISTCFSEDYFLKIEHSTRMKSFEGM